MKTYVEGEQKHNVHEQTKKQNYIPQTHHTLIRSMNKLTSMTNKSGITVTLTLAVGIKWRK